MALFLPSADVLFYRDFGPRNCQIEDQATRNQRGFAMQFCRMTPVLALLLILNSPLSVRASKLWGIYEKEEPVVFLVETRRVLDANALSRMRLILISKLKLNRVTSLKPMFPDAPSVNALLEIYGFQPRFDLRNFNVLTLSPHEDNLRGDTDPFELANYLLKMSSDWEEYRMRSVEPDLPLSGYPTASALSSASCPDQNSAPKDRAWHLRKMRVPEAWKLTEDAGRVIKGGGEKIGHPDTGYSTHLDLDDDALEKHRKNNFIENGRLPIDPLAPKTPVTQPGHGTSTGSVIISRGEVTPPPPPDSAGGTAGSGKVTGVACEADLVPYRAIRSVIRFTYGNIEQAMYQAVNDNCSVISLSLGGTGHSALNAVMEYAIGKNVIVVAAAGNRPARKVVYPARYPFCIAVAATNFDNEPWDGSARGREVTVSAPGEAVWRALRTKPKETDIEKVAPSCGTSYSTANVAGIAALWLAHHGRSDLIDQFDGETKLQFVFKRLLDRTANRPAKWNETEFGSGIADAAALLKTDPGTVRDEAIKDYRTFIERKREPVERNLRDIKEMYDEIRGDGR